MFKATSGRSVRAICFGRLAMKANSGTCTNAGCGGGRDAPTLADLQARHTSDRRDFIKQLGSVGIGLRLSPALAFCLQNQAGAAEVAGSAAVKTGAAQHITILHTSDIHAQLEVHDEFFYEEGKPAFRRRGGFA